MKRLIFTAIICLAATTLFAQTDSVKTSTDTTKTRRTRIRLGFGDDAAQGAINDTTSYKSKAPGFSFGLTFTRFDIGLSTLNDNGSFKLSPTNQFLNYRSWRSSNIGFDILQLGYRFNSSFRIYAAGGFDWTNLRLRESVTILRNQAPLAYTQDAVKYDKNRLSVTYIRVPIAFDFRTHDDDDGRRFHFVGAAELGVRLSSSLKQESKENGDPKLSGNYNFAKFRYGASLRVGYGAIGVFGKYYLNNMFENSPAQDGLRNFSFGMSVGW
ncbi:outer membrane beta-barrel protein [Mucilaginibacter sp. RB4R14]|uniref:outer membrane beta-barrel protein n=1 Tax=Mucilaginibacter aurantiaciroseus TaxID=2949308 RepID=UPI00209195AA|nr:outer membrane beta-barrel protein [Mucilaginibacter aurantiaciroseus]MCO5935892.1 outer membrane beta-barrel protein [Mucilaginibacter aurantiaciroseus]